MVVLSQLICYHEACSYTAKKRDFLAYLSSTFMYFLALYSMSAIVFGSFL